MPVDTNNDAEVARYLGYGAKSRSTIKYQRDHNPVRYQALIDGIKVQNARELAKDDQEVRLALKILKLI